ncbi:aminotransferase class V-fold PLP-dependent enzyme [Streptomyces sp. NPDC094049]|uniref:aminotransferase class V-fold PLP-dependent enzyme n=1 Tax=Streptomyces sp. NPDC094049 TaxID=3154987 RepID=UPI003322D836
MAALLSGHTVFGPTGIGALYARPGLLDTMTPWQIGGGMVDICWPMGGSPRISRRACRRHRAGPVPVSWRPAGPRGGRRGRCRPSTGPWRPGSRSMLPIVEVNQGNARLLDMFDSTLALLAQPMGPSDHPAVAVRRAPSASVAL